MQAFSVIAERLSALDPAHAATYQRNAERARMRLAEAMTGWQQQMAESEWGPYVVFHDGFQYFDREFAVPFGGAITLNPEQLPGLQTLQRIRAALEQDRLSCLFAEVQYPRRYVELMSQMLDLEVLDIDALGVTTEPGEAHYEIVMNHLVAAFLSCAKAD
jgi:zinc transport system substrate-binding protein